ncbi:MAG: bifunctional transaldolase/phosoglucose isomerase [Alphaproteobacteria bacterium]|nr:bifunctional transaldolase/phosoglucose isomerase [Alphaproteobacteria bacterium]MDE2111157.1 bifunctional transaldolase/phosoglucose isomerase [Alphaproteobacteria bacterium]MDE2495975.1 bifunctional transaldolase/phosoglucose isomerase [Alphaproteobacteria bacterium]
MNPLKDLEKFGQAPWLDYVSRGLLRSGGLTKLVAQDGIKGVTSNPSIFEKAIGHSDEYDEEIGKLLQRGCADVGAVFRQLAVADIRAAADVLAPVYESTKAADGYVSMEVSPYLAHDTDATIAEARDIWNEVARNNLMVKVPGTPAGLPAIRQLTSEGLNINVTLLFSQAVYEQVAEAYIAGLEALPKTHDLSKMASVASFFVSRIDAKIDSKLEEMLKTAPADQRTHLEGLRGKIAIANAKLAYRAYEQIFSGPRWEALVKRGARPQRLLWASTGTKNKAYSDVLYVDALIGPDTVNTMPPETMDAFRDHGHPQASVQSSVADAEKVLADLKTIGISLDEVTDWLVADGVDKFADAADELYGAIAEKIDALSGSPVKVGYVLGDTATVDAELKAWTKKGNVRRLWAKDKALWTGSDENKWLGWLDIAQREKAGLAALKDFSGRTRSGSWSDVALLGMGGSSLGAEVVRETFGQQTGWPRFHILDSTDPDEIHTLDEAITLATTLFIVASKSGSTLEPNIFKDYYFDRVANAIGKDRAGGHFVAITDPGSALEKAAAQDGFADVFNGDPAIGGRYSVLSNFGLVPAAAMGIDLQRFIDEACRMQSVCGALNPPKTNPGVRLGITLGTLATQQGRDKITVLASKGLSSFGAWMEQLIAESTGKHGKGLIPVDGEPIGKADSYGADRVFVALRLRGEESHDALLSALTAKGHPIIRINVDEHYHLARLFFLWEIATATAGAILGINPFDQPDVEAAKIKTRALMEAGGSRPNGKPIVSGDGVSLYAGAANAKALARANTLDACLKAHFARVKKGDYTAFLAFIERNADNTKELNAMRAAIRNVTGAASCLGFGPRFLHSTGQDYKGGPDTGVFLQITCDHNHDIAVPGRGYSFGSVIDAQAAGDLAVLAERGRRVVRIHLDNVAEGLRTLRRAVETALH